jgi:hypothetical protein
MAVKPLQAYQPRPVGYGRVESAEPGEPGGGIAAVLQLGRWQCVETAVPLVKLIAGGLWTNAVPAWSRDLEIG